MPKKKAKTVGVKSQEESPRVKEEEDEYDLLDVKQEPAEADLDEEADYLEPTVTITQDDEDDPGPVISVKVELEEGEEEVEEKEEEDEEDETDIDMLESEPSQASGPFIDVSTISSNTPQMALNTVKEATPVMGGFVSPWPLRQMITVHPTLFIRTTCSKIFLPPGLYTYER